MTPEVWSAIAQVGFPTAAAVYLLHWVTKSLNGKFDRLSESIKQNTGSIQSLTKSIEDRVKNIEVRSSRTPHE